MTAQFTLLASPHGVRRGNLTPPHTIYTAPFYDEVVRTGLQYTDTQGLMDSVNPGGSGALHDEDSVLMFPGVRINDTAGIYCSVTLDEKITGERWDNSPADGSMFRDSKAIFVIFSWVAQVFNPSFGPALDVNFNNWDSVGVNTPNDNTAAIKIEDAVGAYSMPVNVGVNKCFISNHCTGLLGGTPQGNLAHPMVGGGSTWNITHSRIQDCGWGDGQTHNMYADGDRVTLDDTWSVDCREGHLLKCKAKEVRAYNGACIQQRTSGAFMTAGFQADLSYGGDAIFDGYTFVKRANSGNDGLMVAYGREAFRCDPLRVEYEIDTTGWVRQIIFRNCKFINYGAPPTGYCKMVEWDYAVLFGFPPTYYELTNCILAGNGATEAAIEPTIAGCTTLFSGNTVVDLADIEEYSDDYHDLGWRRIPREKFGSV